MRDQARGSWRSARTLEMAGLSDFQEVAWSLLTVIQVGWTRRLVTPGRAKSREAMGSAEAAAGEEKERGAGTMGRSRTHLMAFGFGVSRNCVMVHPMEQRVAKCEASDDEQNWGIVSMNGNDRIDVSGEGGK